MSPPIPPTLEAPLPRARHRPAEVGDLGGAGLKLVETKNCFLANTGYTDILQIYWNKSPLAACSVRLLPCNMHSLTFKMTVEPGFMSFAPTLWSEPRQCTLARPWLGSDTKLTNTSNITLREPLNDPPKQYHASVPGLPTASHSFPVHGILYVAFANQYG